MDLNTLRLKFKEHCSGLAAALTDAEVDEHLNLFYQYALPKDVDGDISRIVWSPTLVVATSTVEIPEYVVSLNQPRAWIYDYGTYSRTPLSVYFDIGQFKDRYPAWDDASSSGKPSAVCVYGRTVYLSNQPDLDYTLEWPCRGGSSAVIPDTGIGDSVHAHTIIHGAAWSYLLAKEDEAGAAREGGQYEIYKAMLNVSAGSQHQGRRPARSF